MGGGVFEKTRVIDQTEYNEYIQKIVDGCQCQFLLPFRLGNKKNYSDLDLIVYDTDKIKREIDKVIPIQTSKIINLNMGMFSDHLLTTEGVQIDLLKSYSAKSMEISRAFFSYSCANVFLKRMMTAVDPNLKFGFLGLICSDNKMVIPPNIEVVRLDEVQRLVVDPHYIFSLIDLDYTEYTLGFSDEFALLKYLQKSKYYKLVQFHIASKFKHDCKRLPTFQNLFNAGLLNVI